MEIIKAKDYKSLFKKPKSWMSGHRKIGGQTYFFRSKWEMNYARYLQWRKERGEIHKWEYEVQTFWFEGIKRGVRSYLPDFKITPNRGSVYFDEVKGYMDARSRTKLKRMKKYYPNITVNVIDATWFKQFKDLKLFIYDWE